MGKKTLGRYIITDTKICHGQPVFRGTRILVADVLEQVANGMAWEGIVVIQTLNNDAVGGKRCKQKKF